MVRKLRRGLVVAVFAALVALPSGSLATGSRALAGLDEPVKVVRDAYGVPHVYATSDHDAYFMVGWLHAQDRLFQMDATRRQASGTLAELLGSGALGSDVQLRTLGLRRAAVLSLAALSPAAVSALNAYAAGVNGYVAAHPLPREYGALELTAFAPWSALDSVAITKLLAFGLSFDLGDIANTQKLVAYSTVLGPLAGGALFTQDVMRSEPFAHAPSIDPGETSGGVKLHGWPDWSSASISSSTLAEAADVLKKAEAAGIATSTIDMGSNVWVVSGSKSASGRAMVASDPHLALPSPPQFYEVGVDISGLDGTSLYGVTFPGTPAIVHGMNEHIAWGSTVNPTDVTDVYQEQVVPDATSPSGLSTKYLGSNEHILPIPEVFRSNTLGNGVPNDATTSNGVTLVVPRHGPLIAANLSVQFTGFYATREIDYFLELSRAKSISDAKRALRYFDFGAQNWMFADDSGNIAYYTDREVPLREDLQAAAVNGLPPYFIRNGTGGNEWIPQVSRPESQAIPYAILPDAELDQLVNPARGWISNANQDPTGQTFDNDPLNELRPGGGIRYISPGHADGNRNVRIRARIGEALVDDGKVSFEEMQAIQSDVKLNDAAVLVPSIVGALWAAQTPDAPAPLAALGADTKVQEAVARLAAWDFSTPTGIPEGYDWTDVNGVRAAPTQAEIDASVAATVYSLWRGQALAAIVDGPLVARGLGSFLPSGDQAMTALRRLLADPNGGASGIFVSNAVQRDTLVLSSLRSALTLAASATFAPAFGGSTNLADYRWGKLHRITFSHLLGPAFTLPAMTNVATDGGFDVVDASSHSPRAATPGAFRFGSGPNRRFVAEADRSHPRAVQVIPGGESGNPFGPFFANQLGLWLTDDYHEATVQQGEVERAAVSREEFVPAS